LDDTNTKLNLLEEMLAEEKAKSAQYYHENEQLQLRLKDMEIQIQ
jgi:hypothetical protein